MASDDRTHALANRTPRAFLREDEFDALEAQFEDGVTAAQVVSVFANKGDKFSEATFRKYVQLGMLPRSRRVGVRGRGSRGLYPVSTIRQLAHIRRLLSQGFSIDEIQREFLFVRGDIESLGQQLDRVYNAIEGAAAERARQGDDLAIHDALNAARELGAKLVAQLEGIERGLTMRARMARAAL